MICAKCGAFNPGASAYCGGCGSPMPSASATPEANIPASADSLTERGSFAPPAAPILPTQQGTPLPGEVFQSGSPQPQQMPDANANANQPFVPPGTPSGAYPAQNAAPTVQQGWQSGAYPPVAGSGSGFPAEAYPAPGVPQPSGAYTSYPAPGAPLTSGAYPTYPAGTPVPGQPYPSQQVSGMYPPQGMYPGQMPPVAPKQPSKLTQRLPLWAFLVSILVVAALLAVLFFFVGTDWAAGARIAGIAALAVGGILLIAFIVRSVLGMWASINPYRVSQIVSSVLLMLILFALGAVGITQQAGIHSAQARFLEGQSKWPAAITEFQDGGQALSSSADLARVYDEWGEQLAMQTKYSDALDKFNMVISKYQQSGPELTRAQNGAASAYFSLAEQDLNAKNYPDAVTNFSKLTTNFASSSQTKQAHADYARALWGQAQAELTSTCSSALADYQQLSSQFGDTPQGQQAKSALALPQPVDGHFTSTIPGNATPQVALAQGITANMSDTAFFAIVNNSPMVNVNKDGTFKFSSIKQGSYYLVWGVSNANGESFYDSLQYPATVGPLCPFHFGDINEAFPSAL